MNSDHLLHDLLFLSARKRPQNVALNYDDETLDYKSVATLVLHFSQALTSIGIESQARVAIFLEKRFEFVIACFGASCSGAIFVPINPILKKDQILHILKDSGAKVFVTSMDRYQALSNELKIATAVEHVILVNDDEPSEELGRTSDLKPEVEKKPTVWGWKRLLKLALVKQEPAESRAIVDNDAVSILYTSGSTGPPKGVVLSHRNMVVGARSVSSYLENNESDRLLAVLPLSFDAGFSQLTTAFHVGARVILLNYLRPNDILKLTVKEKITGITAVPPLWIQMSGLSWPLETTEHLRYIANTGGRMPFETLSKLRKYFPKTKTYLMYGLTEAFRSTYLPPDQVDRRPDSIGKAIPNAEILILNSKGERCKPHEPGELVHRGALVSMGYWKDLEKTAERFKLIPFSAKARPEEIMIPEIGVFSGDMVKMDEEGFIFFIGRNDEMIKTSGYRVSPTEVEEVIYNSGHAVEVAVFGVPHPTLGQAIIACIVPETPSNFPEDELRKQILLYCGLKLPTHMVPAVVVVSPTSLPRNQNGKIDRKRVGQDYLEQMDSDGSKT